MDTNPTPGAGPADDFDQCCDTGYYRRHLTASAETTASTAPGSSGATHSARSYDAVRPAYAYGHRAATNPAFAGRSFDEVEVDLRREYPEQSTYESVRDYVRQGFEWKTALGALAVAAGGWWAGRKLYDALSGMNEEDERDCRTFYQMQATRSPGVTYERARTGYSLGYAAAANPDYSGRDFDYVETHLRAGYPGASGGGYDQVRDFARRGYERGTTRRTGASTGGTTF